jgi:O-methyltransferase involved in polyketide biosynthesis
MDDIQLTAVSDTLVLPLYALALESQSQHPIMVDEGAVDLTRRLNAAFAGSDSRIARRLAKGRLPGTLLASMALRVRRYDAYVRAFLEREPAAVVVNLGCGLDDRRRRVDNGSVRWYDLDLPEVIALRRRFLPETERFRTIASSVLDLAWLEQLPDEPGGRFLFLAEGLFPYLPSDGVRALVTTLNARYPGAELVAEIAHRRIVRTSQSRLGRGKFRRQFGVSGDIVYQFGLEDSREMEGWAPGLTFLDHWTYFDEDEPKLGWMRWFAWWPLFRWAQWTVHYRLGATLGQQGI